MGRFLSYRELKDVKGIRYSKVHLQRLESAGLFPQRIKLGPRSVAWDEDEIEQYTREKRAARTIRKPPIAK